MPQLDTSTFFSQIFWFLIFFFCLFFIVNYLFHPNLERIIRNRNKKLINSFNNSLNLLKITENRVIMYNSIIDKAKIEAEKILDNSLNSAEEMKKNMKNLLEEEDKKINKIVKQKMIKFRSKYGDEIKQMAVNIAMIYYNKLTNSKTSKKKEFIINFISTKKF